MKSAATGGEGANYVGTLDGPGLESCFVAGSRNFCPTSTVAASFKGHTAMAGARGVQGDVTLQTFPTESDSPRKFGSSKR